MVADATGRIGWADLTMADASAVRDFHQQVAGWNAAPFEIGVRLLRRDSSKPPRGKIERSPSQSLKSPRFARVRALRICPHSPDCAFCSHCG